MKCESCQKQFPLPELRFVEDGMVGHIKRYRAFCKDHGLFDLKHKEDKKDEQYPF